MKSFGNSYTPIISALHFRLESAPCADLSLSKINGTANRNPRNYRLVVIPYHPLRDMHQTAHIFTQTNSRSGIILMTTIIHRQ